ncbi:MAG: hypothetical protein RL518_737 [Pseudomonadota bacterium]|jgi:hypothetical protein
MFEGLKKLFGGGTKAHGTDPAQGSDSELSHPSNLKTWEDRSLEPADRLQAYKDFVREKVAEILAATDRVSSDPAKVLEIRDDPETQRWVAEAAGLRNLSPEDFCKRLDRPELRKLLGKNFLGAEAWSSQGIDVGTAPPIPASITKELLESECPLHPGEKIKDTHLLVLIPRTVNNEPYTAVKLDALCATRKGSGDKLICDKWNEWEKNDWIFRPQPESEWLLIPKSDPNRFETPDAKHFRYKRIREQLDVHLNHYLEYRTVYAIELMTAMVLNDLVNGEPRMLDGYNYLRCIEQVESGGQVYIGFFTDTGFEVRVDDTSSDSHECIGYALTRLISD